MDAENECPWCPSGTPPLDLEARSAAMNGDLARLQVVRDQGASCDAFVMLHAAAGGHVECMQFLHADHMPFHPEDSCIPLSCCTVAAAGGHIKSMRFAHEKGAAIDSNTVWFATKKCHECLMNAYTTGHAIDCIHGGCFEYAVAHLPPE